MKSYITGYQKSGVFYCAFCFWQFLRQMERIVPCGPMLERELPFDKSIVSATYGMGVAGFENINEI